MLLTSVYFCDIMRMYVHRRALFACRMKAVEEAFSCSAAAAASEDVLPNLRQHALQAHALLARESVPVYTWCTLRVMVVHV